MVNKITPSASILVELLGVLCISVALLAIHWAFALGFLGFYLIAASNAPRSPKAT